MAITRGFNGEISWCVETSYGAGVLTSSTLLLIANQVKSVKLSRNTPLGETRNIGSYDVTKFVNGAKLFGVTTEFLYDRNYNTLNDIVYRALTRLTGELANVCFQIGVGKDQTTATWYNLKGCRAKSVKVDTKEDSPVTVAIDWSVQDVATSTIKTATCSDTIATSPKAFTGGALKRGASAAWGYVVGSVSLSVDNGLQDVKDIGEAIIKEASPGARTVSGSASVCLTDGGAAYWAEVTNQSSDVVELDFGATSNDPSLRITSAVIGSLEIPLDSDSAVVMVTVPFTGTSIVLEAAT